MENWKPQEEQSENAARVQAEHEAHVEALNRHWRAAHRKRTRAIERQLMNNYPEASPMDRLLIGIAAHDVAVAEVLADAQLLLAKRTQALIDDPRLVRELARALDQVTSCRNSAFRRVEELSTTLSTTRAQRALTPPKVNSPHLRRVA